MNFSGHLQIIYILAFSTEEVSYSFSQVSRVRITKDVLVDAADSY